MSPRGSAERRMESPRTRERQERIRRLFGSMIAWLLFKARRPGMIGRAVAFRGRASGRPARLEQVGEEWFLVTGAATRSMETVDLLRAVGEGDFYPLAVEVIPELAGLLFVEAVNQAERSLNHVQLARQHVTEFKGDSLKENIGPWILASTELDRALRASIASIVLAIAAIEAQLNLWAENFGGWRNDEDHLPVAQKCVRLAGRVDNTISIGQGCYQQLHDAYKRRVRYVHSEPVPEAMPVTGKRTALPGMTVSVEARSTCLAVRLSLIDLANRLGVPKPDYLAYCPPVDPNDEDAWRAASFQTGMRPDPDFPTAMERLRQDRAETPPTSRPG